MAQSDFHHNKITQLGQVLLNFANVIPAGMIVFFPSYKFLNTAKDQWAKSGTLEKFASKKEVSTFISFKTLIA